MALFGLAALAQTANGRLEGSVQDATGAVIPGATVSLVNVRTDSKSQFTTDASGNFLFAVPAGLYSLSVEANGFRKAVVNNIEMTVGAIIAQNVKLEIGATTESVQVEASSVTVQTTESQLARAVTMKEVDTLPQLSRTPITLAGIVGAGIQINSGDPSFSRVNGLRQGANNAKLDGIDVNDSVVPRLGLSMTANNTDSIGELRTVTGAGKAEYGRSAGAQVELITRSGSNDWHGNLFEYLRNTELNANDFFNNSSGTARPKFIQNIYGGSVGTKILRDKWFIFGNFQGRRTSQDTIRNRTVYTPEAKQGIFRYKDSTGAIQSFNIVNNDPFKKGMDPTVAKLLARLPSPNNTDTGDGLNTQGFRFNSPSGGMEDQFTIKSDYNVSNTHRVFLRWSWQRNSSLDALNSADSTYPGEPSGTQGGHRWGYSIGDDWTLKPNLINEFRFGHQMATVAFLRPGRPTGTAVYLNLPYNPDFNGFGQGRSSPVNDVTENLTWLKGKHTFKMGASIRHTLQHGYNESGIYPTVTTSVANGSIVASNIGPSGLASSVRSTFEQMYNDVLGRVDQVTQTYYSDLAKFQSGPLVRDFVLNEGGFFFQDDFKVSRKLTLNLGVRYEYFLRPNEINGLQGYLDKAQSIANGAAVTDASVVKGNNWFGTDWNNFAPRFGFAYDVTGDGRTAIRGNWGMFYDRTMGSVVNSIDGATPGFSQSVPVLTPSGSEVRISDGSLVMPAVPGAPSLTPAATRAISLYVPNPNLRSGYVMSYSLNVQREIFRNTVLEVGYVANRGVKLYMNRDINQPRIYGDFLNSFKELQAYQLNSSATPSAGNILVKMFNTPAAAISALGATTVSQGLVGTAANTIDRSSSNYNRYAAAGLSQTFLRPFPQFNQVRLGVNDGRSYYDSLQLSLRRSMGALRVSAYYTFGKAEDNIGGYSATSSSAEGNGYAPPIDSLNLRLMRGIADFDRKHVFNSQTIYALPFGRNKRWGSNWNRAVDSLAGGWELGGIWIWQSGSPYTVLSQRYTAGYNSQYTWMNYTGSRGTVGSVSRQGNGVYFLQASELAKFTFPGAGEVGNQGRNQFYGPRFFDVDMSMVKKFAVTEKSAFAFRAEAYNLFNNTNFSGLQTNVNNASTFGKFSSTTGLQASSARTMQMSLRFDF
ncbi:MAG: carboxypeptidase regulatory-like domain-containing protein [Acidobacteria bacterium]|nr:carboxypeptidase regulatory-like domain-containing protein [Acidobacteriota bacterium]